MTDLAKVMTDSSIRTGTRVVTEYVSYSNSLPPWFEAPPPEYSVVAAAIRERADRLVRGEAPGKSLRILLPRINGMRQEWAMPSIYDQVLLQVAVASFSADLDKAIDRTRVFSFRRSTRRALPLVEDQANAWKAFEDATKQQAKCAKCVLQIDLKDAFARVDRARFETFLKGFAKAGEAELIRILFDGFSGTAPGIPLVNDAGFFLASAYLSVVDAKMGQYQRPFVRYMDDYRIFADSESELEKIHRGLAQDVATLGFELNDRKTWLGPSKTFQELMARARYLKKPREYLQPLPTDILEPQTMVEQIALTLKDPDQYLTDGVGRMQLASLRKMRVNEPDLEVRGTTPRRAFAATFAKRHDVVKRAVDLIGVYRATAAETWRAVWILYVLQDLDLKALPAGLAQDVRKCLADTVAGPGYEPVVRMWARPEPAAPPDGAKVYALMSADYVNAGKLYHGVS